MKFVLRSLSILPLAGIIFISSCGNNPSGSSSTSDSTAGSSSSTGGTVDSASSKKDSTGKDSSTANRISNTSPDQATIDFMVPANTKEIAWLTAGLTKSSNKEIKEHSKMMLADHKKLGQQVSAYMSGKNLSTPPVDTVGVVNINDLKGKQWDSAWVAKMVVDHKDLLDKLKQSETTVKDTALKSLVTKAEPVVQSHIDMVKKIQDKMK